MTAKFPSQAPPHFNATPESLLLETNTLLEQSRAFHDKLITEIKPAEATFQNVLAPFAQDENFRLCWNKVFRFYATTSTNADLRAASRKVKLIIRNFEIEMWLRQDLFELIDAVKNRGEKLDAEDAQYLNLIYRKLSKNGLGIKDTDTKKHFVELSKRLYDVSTEYERVMVEDSNGIWFTPEELDGIPKTILANLDKGEGEREGRLFMTFKKPHYDACLEYAINPSTRRRIYIGFDERVPENVERQREIVLLRNQIARLLGFQNFAELQAEDSMFNSLKDIKTFINDLTVKTKEVGRRDIAALLKLKYEDLTARGSNLGDEAKHLFHWDWKYYSSMLKAQTTCFDKMQIAEYFPLETTLGGIFKIFERIFGLRFEILTPEQLEQYGSEHVGIWYDDVKIYNVWNDESEGGDFLGYLFFDFYPRPNKTGYGGHYNLQPGFIDVDGIYHYPSSALVMNLTPPTASQPTLLRHEEVRTLFHEAGHGIHSLVSKTRYAVVHGIATNIDFVETPSIMLENWWWQVHIVKPLSCHYAYLSNTNMSHWRATNPDSDFPPKHLPDDTLAQLLGTENVGKAHSMLANLALATWDLNIHSPASIEDVENQDPREEYNRLRDELTGLSGPAVFGQSYNQGSASARLRFFTGPKAAFYYSYIVGRVNSTDLFITAFKNDPLSKEVGKRYRYTILQPGGTRSGMTSMEEFLGRKPNSDAFYQQLKITA